MKYILGVGFLMFCMTLEANNGLKKAFSEGIKASILVLEHEKSQALSPIPKGYCATISAKTGVLSLDEEIKLESLALFLKYTPSLFETKKDTIHNKRVLCLVIAKEKEEAMRKLKEIGKLYPRLSEYITKVEILPAEQMYRIIPGIGRYHKDESKKIASLEKALASDEALKGHIIQLKEKTNKRILFDNNSTRVLTSTIPQVLFVEHTVYRRRM